MKINSPLIATGRKISTDIGWNYGMNLFKVGQLIPEIKIWNKNKALPAMVNNSFEIDDQSKYTSALLMFI